MTPKPSVGSDQVYWVITFTVDQMDKFKQIVKKLVAATEKEPGTLAFEYSVGNDQKTVDLSTRGIPTRTPPSSTSPKTLGQISRRSIWRWPNPSASWCIPRRPRTN